MRRPFKYFLYCGLGILGDRIVFGIKMAAQKFAQEVPKIATLEACRIGLN